MFQLPLRQTSKVRSTGGQSFCAHSQRYVPEITILGSFMHMYIYVEPTSEKKYLDQSEV